MTDTISAKKTQTWVGTSVPRKEDGRLLKGQGSFVDDEGMHRQCYAEFVRSPFGHARIVSVDVSRAEAHPLVIGTLTGDEVREMTEPFMQFAPRPQGQINEYALAVDKVRFQGDPVVLIMAETREAARDAVDLVEIEYEPLPAVVDGVATLEADAPVLHDSLGDNIGWHGLYDFGDIDWALENADHVVKIDRLHFHRFSSTPLECFAAIVNWDPGTDVIEVLGNLQFPMFAAMLIGPVIGVGIDQFDMRSQDIGGGFGIKINLYTQVAALALASRKVGRPVKWVETRTDHHMAGGHGNERTFLDIEVPILADGTILGIKARAVDDAGAYLHYEPLGAVIWSQVIAGAYKFRHVSIDFTQVLTNKCPTVPNRGYSRMQQLWMIERVVDIASRELGFDPVEFRKKNYIQPEDYPYETPNGCIYDSGNLPLALDTVLELVGYEEWKVRQREAIGTGKRIGIGIGTTLDSGTNNFAQAQMINPELPFSGNGEACTASLDLYGEIVLKLGTSPQGQGHETSASQVACDYLGCPPEMVHVRTGFNKSHGSYVGFSGTYASQFAVTGINAVIGALEALRADIVTVAAAALGATDDEIELIDGFAKVRGDAEREMPFMYIANLIYSNSTVLPREILESVTLNRRFAYVVPFEGVDTERKFGNLTLTYATQTHVAVVEIDEATGALEVLDYAIVDDCGTRINPMIVEGQVHGAASHGLAAALQEAFVYDSDGQLLTNNFLHYHVATAVDVPHFKTAAIESPSPFSGTGAKGMGEGGGAPLHTLCAAIQDALDGEMHVVADSYNPPERIFNTLRSSGDRGVTIG
jgi:CO/xanthine dehydrogenase Mo-binding subunit